MEQNRRY